MIRAKVLGRKLSEKAVKVRLEGYFLRRLPCQDGVKDKLSKDPGNLFGKAMYRLHVYRRNPRDGYYFHERKNDRIKTNEDLDLFLWWL